MDLSAFDFKGWLNANNVPYDTDGKNVQSGWIAIQCPFCDDHSNHLGINPETNGISCWRCPAKGTIIKIVMKLKSIPPHLAVSELKNYQHRELSSRDRPLPGGRLPADNRHACTMPLSHKSPEYYHTEYLRGRNFNPDALTKQFKLQFTGPLGDYRMRIIVPIYMRGQLVSFTTRDVTGKARIPWIHGRPDHVMLSPKECLYNLDTVKDTVLVVEGASDVWRLGDATVATFGDKYTVEQVRLLQNVKRAFILFDTEDTAQQNAEEFAYDLSAFVSDVNVYQLDSDDPGDLSEDDVKEIRIEIFGKQY